ncbi:16S rRNA (adenine(1518)-N(6)/adenine(1519)-N(6))-dimethyltransferase [Flavobacteriaceae bacterium UJ101]|nr:16S rRNA (adenine(1518)-N(6)/adenine(1519)-N(6))-dimethyltransferase [Flavobacteriaceae bacterium UJ101]
MSKVKAKKHLGQHFLIDESIAQKTAEALQFKGYQKVLEIGPGMGVLTQFLLRKEEVETYVVEIDKESVVYLQEHYPVLKERIIEGDFLKLDLQAYFKESFAVVGNFPYNISSQILFKTIENRAFIPEFAGMFQKEVAERAAAKHGNKTYGVLSVLVQAYYDVEYLFTVHENVFNPPPKVKSGVMRMVRKEEPLGCDDQLFKTIVKAGFNQRRKTIRNSLKGLGIPDSLKEHKFLTLRPEQLSVQDFVELTKLFEKERS